MAQLYVITNLKNKMKYYGIVLAEGKTYQDRFLEHMSGKGSSLIKQDLDAGLFTSDDFSIDLILDGLGITEAYDKEIQFIKENDTLVPNGYNGNVGNCIIRTDETEKKRVKTRKENMLAGLHKPTGKSGFAVYKYPNGENKSLPVNHPDVLNNVVRHINYKGADIKKKRQDEEKNKQRIINGGYTDKQIKNFADAKRRANECVITHPNFWIGKKKFAERMKRKDFTEKELLNYSKCSDRLTAEWSEKSTEDIIKRTTPGLDNMNSYIECKHCGKKANKGNIKRWHNENCKDKNKK